jgi:hypothetical protein
LSIAAFIGGSCVSALTPVSARPLIETASLREAAVLQLFEMEKPQTGPVKTLAGKVLTAIALERVTGRKPDPLRFSDRN